MTSKLKTNLLILALIIIGFVMCSNVFAETPCIKIYRNNTWYTNLTIFNSNLQDNDTFTLGKTDGTNYVSVKEENLIGEEFLNFGMNVFNLIGGYTSSYIKTYNTTTIKYTNTKVDYNLVKTSIFSDTEKPRVTSYAEVK